MQSNIRNKINFGRLLHIGFITSIIVFSVSPAQAKTCPVKISTDEALTQSMILAEDIVRKRGLPAPAAARLYALTSIALYDSYKISRSQAGYLVSFPHLAQSSYDTPQLQLNAAFALLENQYPKAKRLIKRRKKSLCVTKNTAEAVFGADIGEHISDQAPPPAKAKHFTSEDNQKGVWVSTPPDHDEPVLPLWAISTPFELKSADQFRPNGPPAIEVPAYYNALDEVKRLGKYKSDTRSQEQSDIAVFWADEQGSASGPGHWNEILRRVNKNEPPTDKLHTLLLLNLAMYDAGIAAWDAKYSYRFWRPVTAITQLEPENAGLRRKTRRWRSLLENPSHPEYVSGHSTFSAAAATILTQRLGEIPFCIDSEGLPGQERCYSTFHDAAREAGLSRIYGGIHFSFSNEDGLQLGSDVAHWVLSSHEAHRR